MIGVILAGGEGTRLRPLTNITNKHLLPVYNKPMIMYPLEFMRDLGITEIVLVAGRSFAGDFADLLGDGSGYGVDLTYRVQEGSPGIAQALGLAEKVANHKPVTVILGDNIFAVKKAEMIEIKRIVDGFDSKPDGAVLFLKGVSDPERFGVARIDRKGDICEIEEKPKRPKSNYAVTGFYVYDSTVFEKIKRLKPSKRNELEISDVNNMFLKERKLKHHIVKGVWTDAGTFESLFRATVTARGADTRKAGLHSGRRGV